MSRALRVLARLTFVVVVLGAIIGGGAAAVTLAHFGRDLPNTDQISHYIPAIGSKVYAGDSSLMVALASENRVFLPLAKVPPLVRRAFLAAEDRDFYNHNGVNPLAIFRAGMTDVLRLHKGQRPMGASTITQQVVRHFLLNNEVSVGRKIKEAMLAYRIDKTLSKDRILEIYLNEIYLGAGAYGIEAASQTYFQKPVAELSLAQVAFLAALPKAPNNYNPLRHAHAAKARRDWVLGGMADAGWISADQAKAAIAEPLEVHLRTEPTPDQNGYFAEEVRRELIGRFGEKAVYEGGLTVRTSFRPDYQTMAETAFRNGLVEYDRRHGWRGPIAHLPSATAAETALASANERPGIATWRIAAVTEVDAGGAQIALKGGGQGRIPFSELKWARRTGTDQRLTGWVRTPRDVLSVGDIVFVEPQGTNAAAVPARRGAPAAAAIGQYGLRQAPDVSGGFVVLDPKTGRVFATVGGWDFGQSQFNRATQAKRQPGSAFKPFVYLTALENGFSPSSVLDNSPIELPQGPGLPPWRPVNYEGETSGPSTLRDALIHSYNLVTARLASMIGMPAIGKTVEAFDVMDHMPLYYSMALGAGETTLLRLAAAYGMIDNGGHWLLPSLIDSVQDRDGHVIYQKGVGACAGCFVAVSQPGSSDGNSLYRASGHPETSQSQVPNAAFADNATVYRPTKPDPLVDQGADSEIVSMMQGVVQRGTGVAVSAVGKPLAGKTGTTSDFFDAWFVGFSPNLVAGGYVGFDQPRTLGYGEAGAKVAAPIFRDFMAAALKNAPATPFPVAPDEDAAVASASTSSTTTRHGSSWSDRYGSDQAYNDANDDSQEGFDGSSGGRSRRSNSRSYTYNGQSGRYVEDPSPRRWQDPISRAAQDQAPYTPPPAPYAPRAAYAYPYPPQIYGAAPSGYGYVPPPPGYPMPGRGPIPGTGGLY